MATPENHGVSSESLGGEGTCLAFLFPHYFDMICVKQLGTVCTLLGKINIKPKQAVASLVPSPLVAALAPTLGLFTMGR